MNLDSALNTPKKEKEQINTYFSAYILRDTRLSNNQIKEFNKRVYFGQRQGLVNLKKGYHTLSDNALSNIDQIILNDLPLIKPQKEVKTLLKTGNKGFIKNFNLWFKAFKTVFLTKVNTVKFFFTIYSLACVYYVTIKLLTYLF